MTIIVHLCVNYLVKYNREKCNLLSLFNEIYDKKEAKNKNGKQIVSVDFYNGI